MFHRWTAILLTVGLFFIGIYIRWEFASRYSLPYLLTQVDPAGYHQLAVNLLEGRGFCLNYSTDLCLPNLVRMPGYPAIMAGAYYFTGPDPAFVVVIQILLDSLVIILIGWCAWKLSNTQAAAILGMILHLFNPNAWMFSSAILTEFFVSLMITLLVMLLIHVELTVQYKSPSIHVWVGCLFGLVCALSIYLKPNLAFLPFLLIVYIWFRLSKSRFIFSVLGICFLLLMPWIVRNWLLVERPILSTAFVDNFNTVSAVATLNYANGYKNSEPFSSRWQDVYFGEVVAPAGERFGPFPEINSAKDMYLQLNYVFVTAQEIVKLNQVEFVYAHLDGFKQSWLVHEHRTWHRVIFGRHWGDFRSASDRFWGYLMYLFWLGVYFITIVGWLTSFFGYRHLRPLMLWVGSVPIVLTLIAGPLASFRFRYPIGPALTVFTAIGLARIVSARNRRRI